jgi:PAS domain S-box-containing protein
MRILFNPERAPKSKQGEDDSNPVSSVELSPDSEQFSQVLAETVEATPVLPRHEDLLENIEIQREAITALGEKLRTQYQILDQLPIGVFAKDTQGRHLLVNRYIANRLRREPREIIGLRDEDLSPVELARIYRMEDEQLLSGVKTTIRNETNEIDIDGTNRLMRSQKWALRDEVGQIIGVIGISEDITEERQQQNALAISQQQIALLFEHSPLAIIEWNLDGDITNWNPAAEKMFGVSRKDALGRPLAELALSSEAYDYAERLRELFRRDRALVALSGTTSTVLRIQQRSKEGDIISRDWTFSILTQTQNVVVGFGAMIADVTTQVRAQQQLEQTMERLEMFVEQMPVAIIEWDTQRVIQRWNPAAQAIFGWSAEEAIGREALELLVPVETREHVEGVFNRIIDGAAPVYSENENTTRGGDTILCQWINVPLINELGERIGLASLAQDVTALRRSQEQALALTETQARMAILKQFVRRVSHYFRNHLAQIEVNRHLMQRLAIKAEDDNFSARLTILKESVMRMAEQLDNLSMISSIAGIEEEVVSVSEIAQEAFNSLYRDAQTRSLQYTLVAPSASLSVRADMRALRDALRRLLQNAINYTLSGGAVSMIVRREAQSAVIEVRDTGIGMSEAQLERAFELFYRADEASSLESGGLGLGLNIARMTIENHKGTLDVTSQHGSGSVFTVRLPLITE